MSRTWSSSPVVPAVILLAAAGVVYSLIKKRSQTYGSSSSSLSSSSSTTTTATTEPLPAADYEVFLSFRGPDVRTTLADYLYRFLEIANIRAFLDDERLHKGEEIAESLFVAIEDSKVYIPILSPDYASSKWCLRELARMVKCYKRGNGNIILPIFYMVEPRDVRHQTGCYEKPFRRHCKDKGCDAETLREWKDALEEVGKMKGWHVTERDGQGAIVREVFSNVRSHVMKSYVLVTEQLVSIDPYVEKVTQLLNKCVQVVGIVGMGGLGKSTIAMAVRDKVRTKFDHCFFLRNVRETLSEKGIVALQNQLLSAIPGHSGKLVQDASQGIRAIRDRVCKQRVLIVLDDIDERFEFEQILGKLEDFSSESRFIITTRNQRVLECFQHEYYEATVLSPEDSLQLFSRHAFGLDSPPEDRAVLSDGFITIAAGLPLALKVIGSTLNRKDERFWTAKLKQLKKIPHHEVQKKLMTSYVDLTHEEQQIFLDIASVFVGVSKEFPSYMWSDCDFYPEIGIDALILKSLIKVDDENKFWMHDSVRDLGRAIIREENRQHPLKCSRIWSDEDALQMLTNEEVGTDRLEVLRVNLINAAAFVLTDRHFEKLSGLRYLEVSHGRFTGNFERVLPNLRWLALNTCSLMPVDVNMKKLVVLIVRSFEDCYGEGNRWSWKWSGWEKLKAIDLSNCNGKGKTPDLSYCKDLELIKFDC
ncbi:Disease resistance protein L6 [Linum grandiflorum]